MVGILCACMFAHMLSAFCIRPAPVLSPVCNFMHAVSQSFQSWLKVSYHSWPSFAQGRSSMRWRGCSRSRRGPSRRRLRRSLIPPRQQLSSRTCLGSLLLGCMRCAEAVSTSKDASSCHRKRARSLANCDVIEIETPKPTFHNMNMG